MSHHPDLIDFGKGQPSPSLLPLAALRTAADHALARGDIALLQYGADEGDAGFRESLARFLSRRYAAPVDAAALIVSAGNSQALDLVCTLFTKPGDTIFVEEPTYFLAFDVFRDHGLHVVGIPIDDDGMRIDALDRALSQHRPAMLYTIPSFQNPSGTTMSAARREQLMAVSRERDLLVVADEVYQLLDFGTTPPLPLALLAEGARVLSLGSFSKICAPGLRLGWIHGAPALLHALTQSGVVQSGGGLSPFASGVVQSLLDLGLADSGLDALRRVYAERSAALCDALRNALPRATFVEPQGGYFVWVQLPPDISASQLQRVAVAEGVTFHPGSRFVSGDGFTNWMRLSFAYYDTPVLLEGVQRLVRALARYTELQAFATRYTAAWCSQQAASVAAHFSEHGSLKINAGAPAVGREAIAASAQAFMSAFPDIIVEMDSLTTNGAQTVYHWTLTGTNTGPGGTGQAVRIHGYEAWTIGADGLIATSLGHFDEAEYARQLNAGVRAR